MTSTELTDSEPKPLAELNDSDYPRVYGSPVETAAVTATKSSIDELTANPNPKAVVAIVDNKQVSRILKREGYNVTQHQVKPLNLFPSPMDAFQYALYSFGITDIYIVLMINKRQNTIYGYHILDLTQNYSLVDDLINRLKNKDYLL